MIIHSPDAAHSTHIGEARAAPPGPDGGTYLVLRGGSWANFSNYYRAAFRSINYPSSTGSNSYGFRVARSGS